MKGMLIKDLHLMKMQKRFFLVMIGMGILLSFSTNDLSFAIGYVAFVMPMFALNSISYDEFDNGNAFLFTLPIGREEYVAEKYIFGLLLGVAALAVGTLLALGFGMAKEMTAALEALKSVPMIFLAIVVVLSVMIPLQFKFGTEKSRIAIIAVGGGLFVIGLGLVKLLRKLNIDPSKLADWLDAIPMALLAAAAVIIVAVIFLVSMRISMRIMRKKEF